MSEGIEAEGTGGGSANHAHLKEASLVLLVYNTIGVQSRDHVQLAGGACLFRLANMEKQELVHSKIKYYKWMIQFWPS